MDNRLNEAWILILTQVQSYRIIGERAGNRAENMMADASRDESVHKKTYRVLPAAN